MPQSPLHLRNAEALSHQTSQSSYIKNMVKDQLSKKKWIAVWTLASRARKVLGTFEKYTPGVSPINFTGYCKKANQTSYKPLVLFRSFVCCCWFCSVLFFTSRRGYWVEINKKKKKHACVISCTLENPRWRFCECEAVVFSWSLCLLEELKNGT